MTKIKTVLFTATLAAISLTACKNEKEASKTNAKENTETTIDTPVKEAMKTESTSVVLNANLATEKDLIAADISPNMITQIIEKRPFLNMNDFDALLGSVIDKTELYKKVFIPFNLNTTAEADFKMIPGVGKKNGS